MAVQEKIYAGERVFAQSMVAGLGKALDDVGLAIEQQAQQFQTQLDTQNTNQTQALNTEATTRTDEDTKLQVQITENHDAIAVLNADENTDGSFKFGLRSLKDSILNGVDGAFDTLKEIQAYTEVVGQGSVAQAILDSVANAKKELRGVVDPAMDTLGSIANSITAFKDEVSQRFSKTTTDLQAYADNAARMGGLEPILEDDREIRNNRIMLSFAPKNGLASIQGWGAALVKLPNSDKLRVMDLRLDLSDTSGRTFLFKVAEDGELDGGIATVQYFYTKPSSVAPTTPVEPVVTPAG